MNDALNRLIWVDLSTYDVAAAKSDYSALFGWAFAEEEGYHFAFQGDCTAAALFLMPERLAQMNMPSFWMSYVHVKDVAATVEAASQHPGVIIEVPPQEFGAEAMVALIRDPSGAGFTVYQGPEIDLARGGAGQLANWYHHSADVAKIAGFYGDLFGWDFKKIDGADWQTYDICHASGATIARAEEVPETVRGTFSYWMPSFGTSSLSGDLQKLETLAGGAPIDLPDGRALVSDRQGGHFMLEAI